VTQKDRHCVPDLVRISSCVRTEQRRKDGVQCRTNAFLPDIDRCGIARALIKTVDHPPAAREDRIGHGVDAGGPEHRIHELALLPPELAVARQQSLAQDERQAELLLYLGIFDEALRIADERLLGHCRMRQNVGNLVGESQPDNVPVLGLGARE